MAICYIGIGSNIGDKKMYIDGAITRMSSHPRVNLMKVAPFYKTAPWGYTEQDWFLNTVVQIRTDISPERLLGILQAIENDMGRLRKERWGPRNIDLDILLYGDKRIDLPDLKVPHPEMKNRAFVLIPLADLCPDLILPDGESLKRLVEDEEIIKQEIERYEEFYKI